MSELKIRFWVRLVLVLIVTLFIWSNSIKNAEISLSESGVVVEVVEPALQPILKSEGEELRNTVSFIVRKTAHFLEFCALGFVASGLVSSIRKLFGKEFMFFTAFYTLAVAVIDEYIQSFSDRSSMVQDVFIDFSGALFGMLCFTVARFLIGKVFHKMRKS